MFATQPILNEYLEIIFRLSQKMNRVDLFNQWCFVLPNQVRLVGVKKNFHLCHDPKDDKFIDCAIAGQVNYLISGDQDLLTLNKVMQTQMITPRKFLDKISNLESQSAY